MNVRVFTFWPDAFCGLAVKITVADQYTENDDLHHAKACLHCRVPAILAMSQFENACHQAGVLGANLTLGWEIANAALVEKVMTAAAGRKILLFQPPKIPKHGEHAQLEPNGKAFRRMVEDHADYFRVMVGHPRFVHNSALPCELDLFGQTTVTDLFDLATICDRSVSEAACYLPILAQAANKPFTCMFASRGFRSLEKRVSGITPNIFHKKSLATVVFDE